MAEQNKTLTMEKLVNLCKNRGFIFPGSEIYGGLANSWDYGPLGVEFKNNVKKAWWKRFVQESKYNVGLDSAIIMNPETWVASGHVGGFSDPLMDCKQCKARHRADKLIEDYAFQNGTDDNPAGWSFEQMADFIKEKGIACPDCGGKVLTKACEHGNGIFMMKSTDENILINGTFDGYMLTKPAGSVQVTDKLVQWSRGVASEWFEVAAK